MKDIIFKEELDKLSSEKIKIIHTLSKEVPVGWTCEQGRICRAMVEKYVSVRDQLWYICGPPPMVESMKSMLTELGVPEANWRIDTWQIKGKTRTTKK